MSPEEYDFQCKLLAIKRNAQTDKRLKEHGFVERDPTQFTLSNIPPEKIRNVRNNQSHIEILHTYGAFHGVKKIILITKINRISVNLL
ncbi:hypothetical protein AA106555_0240 [Neokomagataea thailandica NBRC 106555]|uniref:Uncharacterized protein n=1 Tax=Neokomagataea thailandica NBRC 106555 TaxID=1223520 RepID=A0ABQ0QMK0_9PROT|nr:hypothetical protein AA106555_0240 [Neokomagataea thailandica NBRC 106555]